ncbi:MAG: hypothetical protein HKN70_08510 [Gammaproteobacteria bacterium]|nr:hypothetical protein [Gammaproteobacteria bacterium]
MKKSAERQAAATNNVVSGEFVDYAGERCYVIRNVDQMTPFFMSIISNVDHWMFVSSTGGLTAGRVSPEFALFPYTTVDKIHESPPHTGCKTLLRVTAAENQQYWEPFNDEHRGRFRLSRNLYKNVLGNKVYFEEINHDLQLSFRYAWVSSDRYGFARQCQLQNIGTHDLSVELVDGLQNILPADTPRFAQTNTSNLVDAYKWTELDESSGLAMFTLYSGITDRAEPCESLKANTVFCLGLEGGKVLLSSKQFDRFYNGQPLEQELHTRGIRGAYFVNNTFQVAPQEQREWQMVADLEKSQGQVLDLQVELRDPAGVAANIADSVNRGSDKLARIMACGDGFQSTAEETVAVHHYANVLFNILRGGYFFDQYNISSRDFVTTIGQFNRAVAQRNKSLLNGLPDTLTFNELLSTVHKQNDAQLERLCYEYLPITFGRRHGDPSRPWNQFAIVLKDEHGNPLLSYEGNWRDIFQNWEALAFSYPEFIENIIAKFVNASTMDGYNPYRITKQGIDWEVEEPDDPWSYIGYWGDHQIIYLQKLLELSQQFHPARLNALLHQPIFCYANVPYRIKPFAALLKNPKSTVDYDEDLAKRIEQRVTDMGADGKLVLDAQGNVYQVNLLEKLLVPLLGKLSNLVIDGGVWMNTQRPEWNDANNALVGHGLSMVTLYYMRRYVTFLQQLLTEDSTPAEISDEVAQWLTATSTALATVRPLLGGDPVSPSQRFAALAELGEAASHYRLTVYQQDGFSGKVSQPLEPVLTMLNDALAAIDHSISNNQREDGLYHAYNLLHLQQETIGIDTLYPMLEGQVAALSAGAIAPQNAVAILEALFASDVYRPDQQSFMLYPDRNLPGFLDKNRIPTADAEAIPLVNKMVETGDQRIVERDAEGCYRFNAECTNSGQLNAELDSLIGEYGQQIDAARDPLLALYEKVFNHRAFTGRSGGMFGFEGLGSIYWHMVAKLLLAVQENCFAALDEGSDTAVFERLAKLYYRVRVGIGFNKTPTEYGAFPTDPYSHTPKHAGARQPGMTGQVKEEVLSRFGELGVRVNKGAVRFQPQLLRAREFVRQQRRFRYLDVDNNWQELELPASALAFTWCQVPVIYELNDSAEPGLLVYWNDGQEQTVNQLSLPAQLSSELFCRSGKIRQLRVNFGSAQLYGD